jgi:NEDD4-binding protein 2
MRMLNKQIKVMRGIPGSGKSTLAKEIAQEALERGELPIICSADDYFIGADGVYRFNAVKLGEAHKACMRKFLLALQDEMSPVIVDNTNINLEDLAPYVAVGQAFDYEVEILQVNTPIEVAVGRNVHGVGESSVRSMDKRLKANTLPSRFKVVDIY